MTLQRSLTKVYQHVLGDAYVVLTFKGYAQRPVHSGPLAPPFMIIEHQPRNEDTEGELQVIPLNQVHHHVMPSCSPKRT